MSTVIDDCLDNRISTRMTGMMIAILPVVALYPFMQKYSVRGITLGSVKE